MPYRVLITGRELEELKKHTWQMAEAFGLDRRIEMYQGKRPITLYAWDLDCLVDVMADALAVSTEYPTGQGLATRHCGASRPSRTADRA